MQIDYPTRINILSAAIEKVHIRCIELARYFFESINPLIIISLVNYIMFEHLSSDTDAISAFLSIFFHSRAGGKHLRISTDLLRG